MYFKEIIGFKITSYKTEAAFKLSQNRNEADFQAIIEDLKKDPSNHSLVRAMLDSRK
jgi:predicted FMN-binding regulatory protein PaiB